MIWSHEAVMKKLGNDAQVTAGGIITVIDVEGPDGQPRKKHIKVGYFSGMTFHLTPEGLEFLEPTIEDAVIVSETKRPRAKKEVVTSDGGLSGGKKVSGSVGREGSDELDFDE